MKGQEAKARTFFKIRKVKVRLIIEASILRNDEVKTSDGKQLGRVVNIIFDSDSKSPPAWILVFPYVANWLKEHLTNNWGGFAIDMIKTVTPADELNKIESELAKKGTETAEAYWKKYSEANASTIEMKLKMCYFIPVYEIDTSKQADGHLSLKKNMQYVGDKYRCIGDPEVTDTMMPLFKSINVPDRNIKYLNSITLNLSPVCNGYKVHDSANEDAYIDDLQLDFDMQGITGIIIRKTGLNAGRYLVSTAEFDFSEMRATKPFNECQKIDI